MRKQTVEKTIVDKLLLLVTAILVGAAILGSFALLDNYNVSKGWSFFVYLSIAYVVIVTNFCLPILKKARNRKIGFVLLVILEIFQIGVVFLLCYFEILPLLEKGFITMTIVLTVAVVITVQLYTLLLKHLDWK